MATAPSVSYSMTIRLEVPASGTAVSQLTTAVESSGGSVTGLDVTASGHEKLRIDVTIAATSTAHAEEIVEKLRGIEGVTLGKVSDRTFLMHLGGKIEMASKHPPSATVTTCPWSTRPAWPASAWPSPRTPPTTRAA